jgi:hypothetical protein
MQGSGDRDADRHHENARKCLFVFHLSLVFARPLHHSAMPLRPA